MGSTVVRRAWGITIRRSICPNERPSDRAASIWPTPMVLMPVMKFSEPKAEATSTTVRITHVRYGSTSFKLGSAYTMMISSATPGILRNTWT